MAKMKIVAPITKTTVAAAAAAAVQKTRWGAAVEVEYKVARPLDAVALSGIHLDPILLPPFCLHLLLP